LINNSLDREKINRIDKSGLFTEYENWTNQAKDAIEIEPNIPKNQEFDNILFVGMGGSATSGDIIQSWLRDELKVPFEVLKDYKLPAYVNKTTLVIGASISGETQETISACIDAKTKNATVVSISSGGKLQKVSEKNNIPHTKVKMALVPRASLLYALLPSITLLNKLNLIESPKKEYDDIIELLNQQGKVINKNIPLETNTAKKFAKEIFEMASPPTIYSSQTLYAPGYRFKASLNENSKIRAQHILLPELCHNEIQSWGKNKDNKITSIVLRDENESKEQKERFESLNTLLIKINIKPLEVHTEGKTQLGKIINLIYLLDYISLYLAILKEIDPTPTPHIDEVKNRLKKSFE